MTYCHMLHVTVTSHVAEKEEYKRFWKDDVILYV